MPTALRHGVALRAPHFLLAAALAGLVACAAASRPASAPATDAWVAPVAASLLAAPDEVVAGGGVTLRYRAIGRGTTIVLLHGYGRRLEDWANVADSLAGSYRVVALDLRGFGASGKSADPARYGPGPFADDVVRLLDRLGVRRAHLVGHSLGAVVAAQTAVRHPARVATATLVAGPFFPDSAAAVRFFAPFLLALERGEGLRPFLAWNYPALGDSALTAANAQRMARNNLGSLVAVFRAFPALTIPAVAGSPPTLVIAGTADRLLDYSHALAARWPGARLVDVPGADHGSVLARPEFLAALRAELRADAAAAETRARP